MMISQAPKILARTCQTAGRMQSNLLVQPLLLVQKRCKQTASSKHCEDKPKKSRKLVTIATVAVVGTTIAVITAKHDEDFREWTKEHLPTLDSLVKVAYQEEESYLEFLNRAHKAITEWLKQALYDSFKGVKETGGKKKGGAAQEVCEEAKKPYKPPASAFVVQKEDDKKDVKEKPSVRVLRHLEELKYLEDKMGKAAQDTIQAYHAVVCALKEQAYLIDNLDQLVSKHDCKVWEKLNKKVEDVEKFLDKAASGFKTLEDTANQLKSCLEGDAELTEDVKIRGRNNLTILMGDVHKAKENLEKEKERMSLAKRSWDKVKEARSHFEEELVTLFPNVWLNDENMNLPLDSLDPFIQKVLTSILFLDKELAKLQTVRDAEVSSAIERLKTYDDLGILVDVSVNNSTGVLRRFLQEETQKNLLKHQATCEKNARNMMKQQAEVYSDLQGEAIRLKEREVERKMQQLLEERLANVRAQHKMEIAKMVGRIQGANEAISQRGDKDKDQQEKQQFWSAAQSLLSAVKPIGVATKQKEPKPLKNEITNVTNAAPEGDELVESVVQSIPTQAVEKGVSSERCLRERFMCLEREAKRMAGVPDGEVSLLQVFLARLQAALYINPSIPQEELDNEPIDVDALNNYQLLFRARYFVDRGEFDQAIRYLNLLKGPSLKVSEDWIKDVIVYLETRQAAEVLLAHASASSFQG